MAQNRSRQPRPKARPRIVLCAGLKSSGSTWLFNVVMELFKAAGRRDVAAFYADNFKMFPPEAEKAGVLIVKCHEPSHSLRFLCRFLDATVFVTVREPRDSLASLRQRFGHHFETSLGEIARQAPIVAELARDAVVFRYEDGFCDRPQSVTRIAAALGLRIGRKAQARIFASLSPDSVKAKIEVLKRMGKFGRRPSPDDFDPTTHWHPGHVGDGRIGKFDGLLSEDEQKRILAATKDYCQAFRYGTAPKSRGRFVQVSGGETDNATRPPRPRRPSPPRRRRR